MYTDLVSSFCTPPERELTNFDVRSIAKAEKVKLNLKETNCLFIRGGKEKQYYWFTDGVPGQVTSG